MRLFFGGTSEFGSTVALVVRCQLVSATCGLRRSSWSGVRVTLDFPSVPPVLGYKGMHNGSAEGELRTPQSNSCTIPVCRFEFNVSLPHTGPTGCPGSL